MTKLQEVELKKMTKKELLDEIEGLYAFIDFLMESRHKQYPFYYYYYPPFHPYIVSSSSTNSEDTL